MKKIFLLVVTMLLLTACGSNKDTTTVEALTPSTQNEESISNTQPEISTEATKNTESTESTESTDSTEDYIDSVLSKYYSGEWDGSFIYNDQHCASIVDGFLWIDCESTTILVDVGPGKIFHYVCLGNGIFTSNQGTWVQNTDDGTLELWYKKHLKEKRYFRSSFHPRIYQFSDDCFVESLGEHMWIHTSTSVTEITGVLHTYESEGQLLYSTLDHENYVIRSTGEVEKLDTSYLNFPEKQAQISCRTDQEVLEVLQSFDLESINDYKDYFKRINNNFLAIDYNGDIILNNERVGNIYLGIEYTVEHGANLDLPFTGFSDQMSFYFDGQELIKFDKGYHKNIDVPDGKVKIEGFRYNFVIFTVYGDNGKNTLCAVGEDNALHIISTNVLDCFVAKEGIYFMEGTTVYLIESLENSEDIEIFVEGAYGVSHKDSYADYDHHGAFVPTEIFSNSEYCWEHLLPYNR